MATYIAPSGDFTRDTNYITTRVTADGRDGYPVEPGRYRLIVARACPWANRAIIVRRLLGLESVLSIGFCGPTHDERSWTFDLDPGQDVPWSAVIEAAFAVRARLEDFGLASFVKTSGGKGLHVLLPVEPGAITLETERTKPGLDTLCRPAPAWAVPWVRRLIHEPATRGTQGTRSLAFELPSREGNPFIVNSLSGY